MTHNEMVSTDQIKFTNHNVCELIKRLRQEDGKGIWTCGGADLADQLIREDLIDVDQRVYFYSVIRYESRRGFYVS